MPPTGLTGKEAILAAAIKASAFQKNTALEDLLLEDGMDWLFEAVAEAVSAHIQANLLIVAVDSSGTPITHTSNI